MYEDSAIYALQTHTPTQTLTDTELQKKHRIRYILFRFDINDFIFNYLQLR